MIKVYQMDVRKALKMLPDESIDCVITSPPYWSLRDYGEDTAVIWDGDENCEHEFEETNRKIHSGTSKSNIITAIDKEGGYKTEWKYTDKYCKKCGAWFGQIGLEPDFNLFISHLLDIFSEIKRVLKKTGTVFVNLGDSYYGGDHGRDSYKEVEGELLKDPKFGEGRNYCPDKNRDFSKYQAKCLCGIPERFMLGMIDKGWILRNKIVWHKLNHMPSSCRDRFCTSWEYLYFFTKSKHYFFDLDGVREPRKPESIERIKAGFSENVSFNYRRRLAKQNKTKEYMIKATLEEKETYDEKNYVPKYKEKYDQLNDKAYQRKILGIPHDLANCNPKGKNPSDVIKEDWLSQKYLQGGGHSNRQGLNRQLDIVTIKAYKEYQQPIANFLKKHIKLYHHKILDETFGESKWRHWIRIDFSGAALPGVEDWFKLKEILNFDDTFDDKIYEVQKLNIPVFQSGRNPSDSWTERSFESKFKHPDDFFELSNQPFSDAHFAVFPEALLEKPIKAGCPKGGIVLDPFVGSGTTLKVARDLGRDAIGIEIKPDYIKIIKKRLFGSADQTLLNPEEFKISEK